MMTDQDAIKTQMMTRTKWLPPVDQVGLLPIEGVADGTRCFVATDDEDVEDVYEYQDGIWIVVDQL